jgi:hypothetical protein
MGPYCIWTAWHCSAQYTAQMNHVCNLITGCNDPPQGRCAYTGEMNPLTTPVRARKYHHTTARLAFGYRFVNPDYIDVVNNVDDLESDPSEVTLLGTNPRFVRIVRVGGRPAVVQLLDIEVRKTGYPMVALHLGFEVDPSNPAPPNPLPSRIPDIFEPGVYEVDDGTHKYNVILR